MAKKLKGKGTHRQGKLSGYENLGGGVYRLAPMYIDPMREIRALKQGLNDLADTHNAYIYRMQVDARRRVNKWFDDVIDDLSLPSRETHTLSWDYESELLTVKERPKPEPQVVEPTKD